MINDCMNVLAELGYTYSQESRSWYPKDADSNAPLLTGNQALDLARMVLYRDDIKANDKEEVD